MSPIFKRTSHTRQTLPATDTDIPHWAYSNGSIEGDWRGTCARANVAQLVEQLIRNEQVSGSSPLIGSLFIPSAKVPVPKDSLMVHCLASPMLSVPMRPIPVARTQADAVSVVMDQSQRCNR